MGLSHSWLIYNPIYSWNPKWDDPLAARQGPSAFVFESDHITITASTTVTVLEPGQASAPSGHVPWQWGMFQFSWKNLHSDYST